MILYQLGHADKSQNISDIFFPFLASISRMKDKGFREEGEVRFVYSRENPPDDPGVEPAYKPVRVRAYRGGLVPYVKLLDGQDERLPIKRVIVGPHRQARLRRQALEMWFAQIDRKIEVTISSIPYLPE